jgi:hypothetical protein
METPLTDAAAIKHASQALGTTLALELEDLWFAARPAAKPQTLSPDAR